MAGETYYYFFSIISVLGGLSFVAKMMYFKLRHTQDIGKYKPGTPEYEAHEKLSSTRRLVITIIATLLLIANLMFDTDRMMRLRTRDAHFALIFAPVSSVVLFAVMLFYAKNILSSGKKKL